MKKLISVWTLIFSAVLIFTGCEEKPWSEDYDINWPITTITGISPATAAPGSVITISGTNMEFATSILIGTTSCTPTNITSTSLQITVPTTVKEASDVSVVNIYRRTFVYKGGKFTPSGS